YRNELIESAAESSDELMMKYLDEGELTNDEIKAGIRALTIADDAYPVFCGSAFKNRGVQPVIDAVVDYLPSPLDVESVKGTSMKDPEEELTRKPSLDEPFSALAFKIAAHPFFGTLTYIRVYSGKIKAGDQILNATKQK
ncbi:elongation factor G, partial [Staphylococcus aureus]